MADVSESVNALLAAFGSWDTTHSEAVTVYTEGLFYASVCTSLDDEATDTAMAARPATATRGWTRSLGATFADGSPNPFPCDQQPEARRHVLYEA